ncbi:MULTISPECIES: glycosyltransferase family 4 protein [Halomonadaceae]|jgi:glycosyltransferase involved in cell wall biosynthesis|uniref:Glycosyltransferase family 4 protein n=1 Tax=Billgrantia aerodenitrificans TaxID=2733483 RepID=A0ABS9ASQ7_9GAMM|nr:MULTISPECIES: glycosyltransferase family 4 protein [Halomonas]MCE8024795.1 glycosyltransferase family 4 protein [Halomonas aerodenitrificans]
MKVVHLTSAHPRFDTRIFHKQCRSLAAAGYSVTLVVADGEGDEERDGVSIVDVGKLPGRLNRVVKTTQRVLEQARQLDADIYHLHDPELMPVGRRLKRQGKCVVYDAHEDLPRQMLAKHYLNKFTRHVLSRGVETYQRRVCRHFDAVVAATPYIRDRFEEFHPQVVDVNNFPMQGELDGAPDARLTSAVGEAPAVCYVGGIAEVRGIRELVRAMERVEQECRLQLAGDFKQLSLEQEVMTYAGWARVEAHGYLDRAGVRRVMAGSIAGLVTLHPIINYLDALPVKMFEYMSAGLPVIASDFPLWREIVEGSDCGICVDPLDPEAIAEAIDFIVTHPERAREMGRNGQRAVAERYNWQQEERKLLDTYLTLSR